MEEEEGAIQAREIIIDIFFFLFYLFVCYSAWDEYKDVCIRISTDRQIARHRQNLEPRQKDRQTDTLEPRQKYRQTDNLEPRQEHT